MDFTVVLYWLSYVGVGVLPLLGMASGQNKQSDGTTRADSFNLMLILSSAHATSITVFIRTGFGVEALGFPGLFAAILICLIGVFNHAPEMFNYLGVWLIALMLQRITTASMLRRGRVWHSRDTGYPALAMKLTRNMTTAIRFVEPAMCLVAGVVLSLYSQVLGVFVGMGVLSLTIRNAVDYQIAKVRIQGMVDAQIEQQWLAQEVRRRTGSQ